ncbi:hypothetical protein [Paraburkholderia strydomiana]|uniref:hypothetical protein n=1 Tax=Paraburkholderia strydomiana TaxID=1245417 RepID=UPI0038BB3839
MTSSNSTVLPANVDHWIAWVNSQPVDGWRIVTLGYPLWTQKEMWRKPIAHTMRELGQTFLKGEIRRQNEMSGATQLRRVVVMGGDRAAGVELHAHCLIDGIGDDADFEKRLRTVWTNNVRKFDSAKFREEKILVFSRPATDGIAEYMKYTVRHEGHDLRFGVDKIDVSNTYLTPSTFWRLD